MSDDARDHAEQSLLGAVMLAGAQVLDRVALRADEFFDPKHREIWSAMLTLQARKQPPGDLVLLEATLGEKFTAVGKYSYLSDLVHRVPTADNAEHYGDIVRDAALLRRIRIAADTVLAHAREDGAEGSKVLEEAYELLGRVGATIAPEGRTMPELARETWTEIEQGLDRQARGEIVSLGVSTGIEDLDAILGGGLQRGVVTLIAGATSMGKSSLARTMAYNIAARGEELIYFSPEDSARKLVIRLLADLGEVPITRIKQLALRAGDANRLVGALDKLHRTPNWMVDDAAGSSSAQIAMKIRKHVHRTGKKPRAVVVDFIQELFEPTAKNDIERTGRAMAGLKKAARDEDVAMLVVSQLKRGVETRENARPQLADLRDHGSLEQSAEVVMFVYRDDYYNSNSAKPGIAEIIVAKNKDGRKGTVDLRWDGPCAAFRQLAQTTLPMATEDEPPHGDEDWRNR